MRSSISTGILIAALAPFAAVSCARVHRRAPTITSQPASQTVKAGQSATFSVTATGSAPVRYQWEKNGTAISGANSSTYTTPPTTASDNGAQFAVVVSNKAGSITSNAATLTVTSTTTSLSITMSSLPSGTVQVAYSATLTATGGTTPYSWSIASGSLPASLNLSSSGSISGTATTAGSSTFTIQVKDAANATAQKALSITIEASTAFPQFGHIAIVVEENTDYNSVVGGMAMPYLNGLISQYGLATQYYANTHPSIGNYFMLTTGQTLTNNDGQTPSSFPVNADNVVRELILAGKTWKAYAESMPSAGYTGGDTTSGGGQYYVRHVPLAYLTDVQNDATQKQNLVPFTQFKTDLAAGNLPNYSFITPNGCDDAHDCSLGTADTWLKNNIDPLIKNAAFQKDGLLVIVFDESASDNTHGGGRVVCVLISPAFSKPGYQSTTFFQHQSLLRLSLEGLGVNAFPAASSSAADMKEFFQ